MCHKLCRLPSLRRVTCLSCRAGAREVPLQQQVMVISGCHGLLFADAAARPNGGAPHSAVAATHRTDLCSCSRPFKPVRCRWSFPMGASSPMQPLWGRTVASGRRVRSSRNLARQKQTPFGGASQITVSVLLALGDTFASSAHLGDLAWSAGHCRPALSHRPKLEPHPCLATHPDQSTSPCRQPHRQLAQSMCPICCRNLCPARFLQMSLQAASTLLVALRPPLKLQAPSPRTASRSVASSIW